MRKAIAVVLSAILAVFVCYETDTYLHPRPAKAASQFANIVCDGYTPVSAAADTQVITAGGSNNFVYICSYNLASGVADNWSIVEGTGSTCGTNTKALVGATTAAAGIQFTATTGGSVNYGGGTGAVTKTTVAGNNVCILRSTAGPLSGVIGSTQMPF